MLRKLFALLIGALLISSSIASVFAGDSKVKHNAYQENTVVVNEYEMVKELALYSDANYLIWGLLLKRL